MEHLTSDDIIDYICGKMSEGDSFQLETHLADCDKCAERVFLYNILRENFDEIWDSLSLQNLVKDALEIQLLESLVNATIEPYLSNRIYRWIKDFHLKTGHLLSIVVNTAKKTAEMVEGGFRGLTETIQIPTFSPVGEAVRVSGPGMPDGSRHVKIIGPNGEEIDAYFSSKKIVINIRPKIIKKPWPLVWLLPIEKGTSLIKESYLPEGADFLTAEFIFDENIDTKYDILLEYPEPDK